MNNSKMNLDMWFRRISVWLIVAAAAVLLSGIFMGCATKERIVPVTELREQHHWHTDSIIERDSVIRESTTTIMQLDSAEIATYGIRLKSAERAWLVKTAELQRQIERLEAMSIQKDSVHDSIPYPVEVIKEVPAKLSWWQGLLVRFGYVSLIFVAVFVLYRRFWR